MRHLLALIDLLSLLLASFVLRALLTRSLIWKASTLAARWFGAAAFVLLLAYSLQWLTWYQRPETLAVAALLALSLWLTTVPIAAPAGTALTFIGLILLGLLQGITRADAGVTFHLGVALACVLLPRSSFALPRWTQFTASLAAALAAAGVQLYLMRVVYPYASYGTTPIFELALNLTDSIRLVPFALFLAPSAWVAVQLARRSVKPSPPQTGLLLGTAFFLCLWCVFGKIDEVRIFLPFAFALTPLIVEAALTRLAVASE